MLNACVETAEPKVCLDAQRLALMGRCAPYATSFFLRLAQGANRASILTQIGSGGNEV
jgi:hypothetical protein